MTDHERHLRTAERAYRRSAASAEAKREARNAAILAALDAGLSQRKVAAITGLTPGRIGQLAALGQERSRWNGKRRCTNVKRG